MLFLASTSPRRRELLAQAGIEFELCPPGPELPGEGAPIDVALIRATSKAAGASVPGSGVVLGVDTVVEIDGDELGKPCDRDDARRMIERLAGRDHRVHTAHRLVAPSRAWSVVATATVACDRLDPSAIEAHLDLEEWRDKAGGYGIQSGAAEFMRVTRGDRDTVIGLSIRAVRELLALAEEAGACRPD